MSKTVDDLIGVYIEASNSVVWEAEKRGLCPMTLDMQRAGIAAVVSELMEHFVTGASTYAWDADDLHAEFMKILGDAGDEVAGAERVGTPTSAVAQAKTPATDPAPAVCVWEVDGRNLWFARCPKQMGHRSYSQPPSHCPACKAPIKFTEAK